VKSWIFRETGFSIRRGNLEIGVNGLLVNGERTSFINSLQDLEDLQEILGSGACGFVKKVRHKPTGKIFAIKVFFRFFALEKRERLAFDLDFFVCRQSPSMSTKRHWTKNSSN
jgi:hypothetical protein